MKTNFLGLVTIFFLTAATVSATTKTEKIKVDGKCEMCESRIEKAAKSVEGVSKANWNTDTKILEVSYDDAKATSEQIQTSVAMAGHDTEMFSASDEKYKNLPGCCRYERGEKKTHDHGNAAGCNHEKASGCSTEATKTSTGSCCGGH